MTIVMILMKRMLEAGTVTVVFSSGPSIQLKLKLQWLGGIPVSGTPPASIITPYAISATRLLRMCNMVDSC